MKNTLKIELDKMNGQIQSTSIDEYQFEKNVRLEYKSAIIMRHLNLLKKHKSFIGKEVYKYVNNFKFTDDYNEQNPLNKLEDEKTKFTVLMYGQFEIDLATFFVDKLTNELLEGVLFENSTNKLSNLKHQWIMESKQELLSLYKSFLPQE